MKLRTLLRPGIALAAGVSVGLVARNALTPACVDA